MSSKLIGGVFENEYDAISAIEELQRSGYDINDISVFTRSDNVLKHLENSTGANRLDDPAKTGKSENIDKAAVTGTGGGALLGTVTSLGLLAIPGIGPVAASGPLATALTGAWVGAGGGGIIGALVGAGMPDEKAKDFEEYMKHGYILVLVKADHEKKSIVYHVFSSHHSKNSHEFQR